MIENVTNPSWSELKMVASTQPYKWHVVEGRQPNSLRMGFPYKGMN